MMRLPPSVSELVPSGQLAHFVQDPVRDLRDVSATLKPYTEDRGFPPHDPTMLVDLLHAYSQGPYAYRQDLSGAGGFHGRDGTAEF